MSCWSGYSSGNWTGTLRHIISPHRTRPACGGTLPTVWREERLIRPNVQLVRTALQHYAVGRRSLRTISIGSVLLILIVSMVGCSNLSASATLNKMHEIEKQLPAGLSRQETYRRLRAYGLVARNVDFTHWRLEGHAAIPLDHGEWPTAGQTYPPSPDDLYLHRNVRRISAANPPVEVIVGGGFLFGCGLTAALGIVFDSRDAISKTVELVDRRPCLGLG